MCNKDSINNIPPNISTGLYDSQCIFIYIRIIIYSSLYTGPKTGSAQVSTEQSLIPEGQKLHLWIRLSAGVQLQQPGTQPEGMSGVGKE